MHLLQSTGVKVETQSLDIKLISESFQMKLNLFKYFRTIKNSFYNRNIRLQVHSNDSVPIKSILTVPYP